MRIIVGQHGALEIEVEYAVKPFDVKIEEGPFQLFVIRLIYLFGRCGGGFVASRAVYQYVKCAESGSYLITGLDAATPCQSRWHRWLLPRRSRVSLPSQQP